MARDVGQVNDVTIYGRSISRNIKDVVLGEFNILHLINFSSITIKQMGALPQTLLIRISLVIISKVTSNLPRTEKHLEGG